MTTSWPNRLLARTTTSSGAAFRVRRRVLSTTAISRLSKSMVSAWFWSVSIPSIPGAPRLPSSSAGASIALAPIRAAWVTLIEEMRTVPTLSVSAIAMTRTRRPAGSPSVCASWREITVRSAPVSTTKR